MDQKAIESCSDMTDEPLRVLQVIREMNRAGAETLLMNLYRSIDRSKVQFDFLVNSTEKADYDDEIRELGGNIYSIRYFNGINLFEYVRDARGFFDSHPYRVVHGHIGSAAAVYLSVAKKRCGAYTIAHSHNCRGPLSISEIEFRAVSYPTRYIADYFFGCSEQAGIDRYGSNIVRSDKYSRLNNGIDTLRYKFSASKRYSAREELNIPQDALVVGHVGRFAHQKNHAFLLKIFKEIHDKVGNSRLLLAGKGELEATVRGMASELGVSPYVHFLGTRSDIPDLLMAMDAFVFPSFIEGLPFALVEAQASGLPCFISDSIPSESKLTNTTYCLSLTQNAGEWAHFILDNLTADYASRSLSADIVAAQGFDIRETAAKLQAFYLQKASVSPSKP